MKYAIAILVVALALMSAGARAFFAGHSMLVSGSPQQPSLIFTPPSLSFTTTAGTPSAPQTTVAKNTGNVTLAISSIGMTGANASDFSQTNNCPATIAVGISCNINVTYSPSAAGSSTASGSVVASPAPPSSITGVAMTCGSGCSFTSGTASTIGTASATVSGGSFIGTWSLKTSGTDHAGTACHNYGSDFAIDSTGNVTVIAGAPVQSYPGVCPTATQAGLGGSPFTQAFTFTGTVAGAVPAAANAAGLTQHAVHMDFTNSFYGNQNNWLADCSSTPPTAPGPGTSNATFPGWLWRGWTGFTNTSKGPCSDFTQKTDTVGGGNLALAVQMNDNEFVTGHALNELQTTDVDGCIQPGLNSQAGRACFNFYYVEIVARQDINSPSSNPLSYYNYWMVGCPEIDGLESGFKMGAGGEGNNKGFAGNWHNDLCTNGNGSAGGATVGGAGDVSTITLDYTQYFKVAFRFQSVGGGAGNCNVKASNSTYLSQTTTGDPAKFVSFNPCLTDAQINGTNSDSSMPLQLNNGTNGFSNSNPTRTMWVKSIDIWTCPQWSATNQTPANCYSSSVNPTP